MPVHIIDKELVRSQQNSISCPWCVYPIVERNKLMLTCSTKPHDSLEIKNMGGQKERDDAPEYFAYFMQIHVRIITLLFEI
jgi:hypothetical protein